MRPRSRHLPRRRTVLCAVGLVALWFATLPQAVGARVDDEPFDEVELIPNEPPSWTPNNLIAPLTGLFLGGPGYWYAPRVIEVETTPPGAVLELFYVRRNFQKRYEQADAPARVILPPRIEATSRDSLRVRALLDGYRQQEVKIPIRSREETLVIELAPLPNTLVGFSHAWFAGRGKLSFVTKEALTFRLQRRDEGIAVVLTETGRSPEVREALEGVSSPLVEGIRARQLGEDLVVDVALSERARGDAFEPRSRQSVDPVRGLHTFAIDFVPKDGGAGDVARARDALARVGRDAVSGCALAFDAALREQLEPADLARALTADGSYTDRYLRAALSRLSALSPDGELRMLDGSTYQGRIPIELMAAASQPHEVVGYLAMLRAFVAELEPEGDRSATLHGLIAPDRPPSEFDRMLDAAEARETDCAGSPR